MGHDHARRGAAVGIGINPALGAHIMVEGTALSAAAGDKLVELRNWIKDEKAAGSDEVYLSLNGQRVWPPAQYKVMRANQTELILRTFPFDPSFKLELREYDRGSADDLIESLTITPAYKGGAFLVIGDCHFGREQGARGYCGIYTIDIEIKEYNSTAVVPAAPGLLKPNEDWTKGAFYGKRGTYFADVTGDGKADAIAVNDSTVTVRRANETGFGGNEDWTKGAYYGKRGTYFADVTGDGKADAIAINADAVSVRRSTGTGFGVSTALTSNPYYGTRGTYFVNVVGGAGVEAIVVNDKTVTVRRSP